MTASLTFSTDACASACSLHSQPKSVLALLYFPDLDLRAALQRLRRWISLCRPLQDELHALGYTPRRHSFSAVEVRAIVRHLGEP